MKKSLLVIMCLIILTGCAKKTLTTKTTTKTTTISNTKSSTKNSTKSTTLPTKKESTSKTWDIPTTTIKETSDPIFSGIYEKIMVDPNASSSIIDGVKYFNKVQDAINYAGTLNKEVEKRIFIKSGTYYEKLRISVPYLTLVGEEYGQVILTYDDCSSRAGGTSASSSTTINNASVGFKAYNINFENGYDYNNGKDADRQAVAILVQADQAVFVNCKFISHQDTIYVRWKESGVDYRQYFYNCEIAGSVDFICGEGIAYFDKCRLILRDRTESKDNNGYVCAPKQNEETKYGYVFNECDLVFENREKEADSYGLCRPWSPKAFATFINCYMDSTIKAKGYYVLNNNDPANARFSEYGTYGEGYDKIVGKPTDRKIINKELAEEYANLKNVFGTPNGFSEYFNAKKIKDAILNINDNNKTLEQAKSNLTLSANLEQIYLNLSLPVNDGKIKISWESKDKTILTDLGTIIRPKEGVASVKLVATLELNNEKVYKEFDLKVVSLEYEMEHIKRVNLGKIEGYIDNIIVDLYDETWGLPELKVKNYFKDEYLVKGVDYTLETTIILDGQVADKVDVKKEGEYFITYKFTSIENDTKILKQKIIVKDPYEIINFTNVYTSVILSGKIKVKAIIEQENLIGNYYYLLVNSSDVRPNLDEILDPTKYGGTVIASGNNNINGSVIDFIITGLNNDSNYILFIVANNRLGSGEVITCDNITSKIMNIGQLYMAANDTDNLNANYVLGQDIEALDFKWDNFKSSVQFKGTLDGSGYAIKNLHMTNIQSGGIFYKLNGGKVLNLTFIDSSISGLNYIGFIASETNGTCLIDNVHFINSRTDVILGSENAGAGYFGLLFGRVREDDIVNIKNSSVVNDDETKVNGVKYVGLIAGGIESGGIINLENCYIKGVIEIKNDVAGGIVGRVKLGSITINNCVIKVNVSCKNSAGIIVGEIGADGNAIINLNNSLIYDSVAIGINNSEQVEFGEEINYDFFRENIYYINVKNNELFKETIKKEVLTQQWWNINLPTFDFTNKWELIDNIPKLR